MFEKGLSIAPNYAPIHYNLALTLEDEGDWKGAALHFRKFVELYPDDQQELVQKVKRHLEALSYYEKQ
jgi:tetratricopeptide (TPR) repeat protein